MPPKKPTRKLAKKTAAKKVAVKAVKKVAAKKPAPKPVTKSVAQPAAVATARPQIWQPTTAAAMPTRPHTPHTPAVANTAPDTYSLIKLTLAHFWRSFLLNVALIAMFHFKPELGPYLQNLAMQHPLPPEYFAIAGSILTGSVLYSIFILWWLLASRKLMLSIRLQINPAPLKIKQLLLLWFSLMWRTFLWVLVFVFAVDALILLLPQSNTPATDYLGVFITEFMVPFLSCLLAWWLVLKKRTFSWGTIELKRLKG